MEISNRIAYNSASDNHNKIKKELKGRCFDLVNGIVLAIDRECNVVLINKKGCEVLGYTENELTGKNWIETVVDKKEQADAKDILRKINDCESKPFERMQRYAVKKNGDKLLINWFNSAITDDEGQIIGYICFGEDITKRKNAEDLCILSEEKYRHLYKNTPAMMHSIDTNGVIVNVSNYWLLVMGYNSEEVVGRKLTEFLTEESREYAEQIVLPEFFKKGFNKDVPYQMVKKSGEIVDVLSSSSAEFDSNGKVSRSLTVVYDVTEKKRDAEKLRIIAANTPDHIFIQDKQLKYTFIINAPLELTKEEMMGKTDFDILSKEDAERLTKIKKRILSNGEKEYLATSLIAKDGSKQHFEGTYIPKKNSSGTVEGIIGYFRNVTERVRNEESIHNLKELNDEIIQSSPMGIHVVDKDFKIIAWNKFFEEYTETKKEDIIGKNLFEVFPVLVDTGWDKHYREVLRSGNAFTKEDYIIEMLVGPKKGQTVYQSSKIVPLLQNGQVAGVVTLLEDISERKKSEEELKETLRSLKLAQSASKSGFWDWNIETNKIKWTDEFYQLFGINREQHPECFDTWRKIVHPDDLKNAEKNINDSIINKTELVNEYRVTKPNGEAIWINAVGKTIYDGDKPLRMIGICTDITDKKKAEIRLKESLDKIKALFSILPVGISILDKDCQVKDTNLALANILESTREDILSGKIKDRKFISKDGADLPKNNLPSELAIKTKKFVYNEEVGVITEEGKLIWTLVSAAPLGEGAVLAVMDNTKQKQNENIILQSNALLELKVMERTKELRNSKQELEKINQRLSDIIEFLPEPTFVVDSSERITAWNKSIELLTGISKKEAYSKKDIEGISNGRLSPLMQCVKSSLHKQKAEICEQEIRDINDNPKLVLAKTSLRKDKSGKVDGVIVISKEITSDRNRMSQINNGNIYINTGSIEDITNICKRHSEQDNPSTLCITREEPYNIKSKLPPDASLIILSDRKFDGVISENEPDKLFAHISKFIGERKHTIIILDRLEYISNMHGFNSVARLLYKLSDIIKGTSNIAVARIVESCFDSREMAILRQEFKNLVSEDKKIAIDPKKMEILKLIKKSNMMQVRVNYQNISSEFKLSRMTTRKWVRQLQISGLIEIEKIGNIKIINLTQKGNEVLGKN